MACRRYCAVSPQRLSYCFNFNPADSVTLWLPWHYVVWCSARDDVRNLEGEDIKACSVVKDIYCAVIGAMVECRLTWQRRRNLDKNCTPSPFHPPRIHISHVVYKQRLRVRNQSLSELRLVSNTYQIWYIYIYIYFFFFPQGSPLCFHDTDQSVSAVCFDCLAKHRHPMFK